MKRQICHHVDWLDEGLDGISLARSESFIWIIVDVNRDLNVYGMNSDLDMLRVMFLLAKTLRLLLNPLRVSILDQIESIVGFSSDEVRSGCIELRGYDLSFNSRPRKVVFCVTYDLLFYYEYGVVKLYMLLREDVDSLHYYAA